MNKAIILLIILLIFITGCTQPETINEEPEDVQEENTLPEDIEKDEQKPSWEYKRLSIGGKYADAEIVDFGDKYRMYYSEEPEVQDFKGRVYSSISADGVIWTQEQGTRKEWATFPSVIKTEDNKYRMYFQNSGAIKSATSTDGLTWNDEQGIRIINTENNAGLNLENVAAPTVIKIDNSYLMVYRGNINNRYSNEVPNNNIQILLWATSNDGINFEKKGIALDSRNEEFQGLLDGSELVEWDDEIRLYFWSYKGVYHVTYKDGKFSQDAVLDYTTSTNDYMRFPENPPGDPTLIKINDKWFMYYGQHEKGIYYAILEA